MITKRTGRGHNRVSLVAFANSGNVDSFGRLRTAQPFTLHDSKMIHGENALLWSDQEKSGSGTSSTYDADESAIKIAVSATTAGVRTRQSKRHLNYEPGKSQQIMMTFTMGAAASGITRRVGLFTDDNGIFLEQTETDVKLVLRSSFTGSPVDEEVSQADWTVDIMDGSCDSAVNPSLVELDLEQSQILFLDYEWLGVGTVRCGFFIDGEAHIVHEFDSANENAGVYMTTPNLPVRYEIENDGTGAVSDMSCICNTVISEAGNTNTGDTRWISTGGTHIDANAADTLYAIVGIRLQSTQLDANVLVEKVGLIAETNDDFEWQLLVDPTVAGSFTYSNFGSSWVQYALGATANTVTGGTPIAGDWAAASTPAGGVPVGSTAWLGSEVDGTQTEIVLCARPLSANADIQGGILIRQMT